MLFRGLLGILPLVCMGDLGSWLLVGFGDKLFFSDEYELLLTIAMGGLLLFV